jgi:hypothetical protein
MGGEDVACSTEDGGVDARARRPVVFCSGSCRLMTTVSDGRGRLDPVHSMCRNFVGCNFLTKLHTPQQHAQFLRHLAGTAVVPDRCAPHVYTVHNARMLSGFPDHHDPATSLATIRRRLPEVDVFMFEVCSLKHFRDVATGVYYQMELLPHAAQHTYEESAMETEQDVAAAVTQLLDLVRDVYGEDKHVVLMGALRPHLYGACERPLVSRETIHQALNALGRPNVRYVDPTNAVLSAGVPWQHVVQGDHRHWTDHGFHVFFEYLCRFITCNSG